MDKALYILAKTLITLLQALPLLWVAQLGRCVGQIIYWVDGKHRKIAMRNLTLCFPEKPPREIRALVRENFRRIGENFGSSVKTSGMTNAALKKVMTVSDIQLADLPTNGEPAESVIYAAGHFGNFELFSRLPAFISGYKVAATYRGLRQPLLDQLLRSLRSKTGCVMYERRTESDALKKAMSAGGHVLVLFSDQSVRENGMELPFMGRPCLTSRAPAIMAMRYKSVLFAPICYRTSLGRWRIEIGNPIAIHQNGLRRSVEAVTRDMNSAFEAALRRDPANWFWFHNRWKMSATPVSELEVGLQSQSVT